MPECLPALTAAASRIAVLHQVVITAAVTTAQAASSLPKITVPHRESLISERDEPTAYLKTR
jgi:hypothetical protein